MLRWLKSLPNQRAFISKTPCVCCGSRVRRTFPTIWDKLSDDWELTPELRKQMDRRESTMCAFCRTNARAQGIGVALLDSLAANHGIRVRTIRELADTSLPADLKIAEINALPGLHKYLSRTSAVTCSEYGGANHEDLMALSFAEASLNYVLTSDSLEHVPDFDLALREIHRVLKPAGRHIFTVPVIWDRKTRQRASVEEGKLVHRLPPSHHGDRGMAAGDWLVFNEFGGDVEERIASSGFKVALRASGSNPLDVTIVATKI
jgi:SAM-dependent methyltransferase